MDCIAVEHSVLAHMVEPAALKGFVVASLYIGLAGWPIVRQPCQCHNSCKNVAPREPLYRKPGKDDRMSVPYMFPPGPDDRRLLANYN